MTEPKAPLNIVQLISKIAKEAGALAPQEPTPESGLKFAFRGVNQVVNHVAHLLDEYGVVVYPEVVGQDIEMHPVGNRFLTDAKLVIRYHFVAPDLTELIAIVPGYSQDYSDRAGSQAMSVGFRIALLQMFHLPTQDEEPEVTGAKTEAITEAELSKPREKAPEAAPAALSPLEELNDKVLAHINAGEIEGAKVNELGSAITKKEPKVWRANVTDMKKVVAEVEKWIAAKRNNAQE